MDCHTFPNVNMTRFKQLLSHNKSFFYQTKWTFVTLTKVQYNDNKKISFIAKTSNSLYKTLLNVINMSCIPGNFYNNYTRYNT